uniref:RNA 2'-phosphotransferase n=1 Tax=Desulfobacca acetoxidans TaxID=60893 RepID=A0A7V6DNY9_9BACT
MARLPRQLEDLAKVLTYVLCHRPDEFGLVLDPQGFVPVKQLLKALAGECGFGYARRHHLEQLVGLLTPPRFELAGDKIRGIAPGPADLRRPGESAPALLYIGISPKAHERVFADGLNAPAGQELLLARTKELALKLARRRNPDPVLVTVQAQAAAQAGVALVAYGEDLYLAQEIGRPFLHLPPPPVTFVKPEKPKPERAPVPRPLPGAVMLGFPEFLEKAARPRSKDKKGEPAWKSGTRALRRERRKRGRDK